MRRLVIAAVAGALAGAAPAHAEPPPEPAPPGVIPAPATIGSVLAQTGSAPAGPFGLPDLSAYAANLLLGQTGVPQAPGEAAAAGVPTLSAFTPEYLVPLNAAPAGPNEGTPAPGIGPDADDPGTGRIAFLQRLREMYQAGDLRGALLGQARPNQIPPSAPAG